MAERIHLYELLEPAPRGGPGKAYRARVAEGGGPFAAGTVVQIRIVTEAETLPFAGLADFFALAGDLPWRS